MIPAVVVHLHQASRSWHWRLGDAGEFKPAEHPRSKSGPTGGQFVKKGEEGGAKPAAEPAAKPAPSGGPEATEMEPGYEHPIPMQFRQGLLKYGFRRSAYFSTPGGFGTTAATHSFRRSRGTGGDHVEIYAPKEGGEPKWLLLIDREDGKGMPMREGKGWAGLKQQLDQDGFKERAGPLVANAYVSSLQNKLFSIQREDDDTGVVTMRDGYGNTAEIAPPKEEDGPSAWRLRIHSKTWSGHGLEHLRQTLDGDEVRQEKLQHRRAKLTQIVREQSILLGWNPDQIEIVDTDYIFELGGIQRHAAGTAHIYGPPEGRLIKVYAEYCSPEYAVGLISHEIMHQKWQACLDSFHQDAKRLEQDVYMAGERQAEFINSKGELNPAHAKDYPFYARFQPLIGTPALGNPYYRPPDVIKRYQKDDGVTAYSTEYWKAYADAKETGAVVYAPGFQLHSAFHETLAEMSFLRNTKGDPDGKGPWKALYQAVAVAWWETAEGQRGRKAALRARKTAKAAKAAA